MNTLDATVGGSVELTTVLLKAEATETRTLLNMGDLTSAFLDERRRPPAATGPIQSSYDLLVNDWIEDSGEPGDKYDPELAALFSEATAGVQLDPVLMQEFIDRLEVKDPDAKRLLVNNREGMDAMLLQFQTYTGNPARTEALQGDLEALWFGDDQSITATSASIIAITVVKRHHGPSDGGHIYHGPGGSRGPRPLFLGYGAPAGAGVDRGGAHCPCADLGAWYHGPPGHPLYPDNVDNYRAVHRNRG